MGKPGTGMATGDNDINDKTGTISLPHWIHRYLDNYSGYEEFIHCPRREYRRRDRDKFVRMRWLLFFIL
jgi:hypothetical protein